MAYPQSKPSRLSDHAMHSFTPEAKLSTEQLIDIGHAVRGFEERFHAGARAQVISGEVAAALCTGTATLVLVAAALEDPEWGKALVDRCVPISSGQWKHDLRRLRQELAIEGSSELPARSWAGGFEE